MKENNVAAQAGEERGWAYGRADASAAVLKWAVVLEQAQKCGGREAGNKLSFPTAEGKQQFDTWYAANTPIGLRMRSVFQPIAAQAGDEPMRADFEREVLRLGIIDDEGLERRHDGSYVDDPAQAAWLTWKAAQASPRATADVERDAALEEAARLCDVKYKARAEFGLVREAASARALGEEIRALKSVATTKPGA